jgi:MarR family transcriptional regulator, transcriptional regulator for hemolysin
MNSNRLGASDVEKKSSVSLTDGHSPIFQDIARFRAIIFDSLLKPHDLTMSQGWVLVHLLRENGMNQSELASRLEIATVTTGKLIDRLEARGFVERRADPEDRRSKRVYATDSAKAVVKIMTRTIQDVDLIANQGLDDEKLDAVKDTLLVMRDNLRKSAGRR